jgi:hypothetical protein
MPAYFALSRAILEPIARHDSGLLIANSADRRQTRKGACMAQFEKAPIHGD